MTVGAAILKAARACRLKSLPPCAPPCHPMPCSVKKGAGIVTAAVGLITEAKQAQAILDEGHADWIYLARVLLRDPYWPLHAAAELGRTEAVPTPPQYDRGWNALGKTKMAMPIANPMPRLG